MCKQRVVGKALFGFLSMLAIAGAWPSSVFGDTAPSLVYSIAQREWSVDGFHRGAPFRMEEGERVQLPAGGVFRFKDGAENVLTKAFLPPRMSMGIGPLGRPIDARRFPSQTVNGWRDLDIDWLEDLVLKTAASERHSILIGIYKDGEAILRGVDPISGEHLRTFLNVKSLRVSSRRFEQALPIVFVYRADSGIIDIGGRFGVGTPLVHALIRDDSAAVETLLASGLNPNATGLDGWSPTHLAATLFNEAAFSLLRHSASNPRARDGERWTPLHYAAARGNTEAARILLKRGARVNARSLSGLRPMFLAVNGSPKDLVTLLVENGGRTVDRDPRSRLCPTSAMINAERDDLAELFIEHGAPFRHVSENTDWVFATRLQDDRLGVVRYFVERLGQNVSRPVAGEYPIAIAVGHASLEMVRYLASKGASLRPEMTDGFTLLHVAAANNPSLIPWLAAQGLDLEARADAGANPMVSALVASNSEGVSALLEAGADPNALDHKGEHLLQLATRLARRDSVAALIAAGARGEFSEETALALMEDALRYGIADIPTILIGRILEPGFVFPGGFSGWVIAERHGADRMLETLAAHGLKEENMQALRLLSPRDLEPPLQPLKTPMVDYPYRLQRRYGDRETLVDIIIDREGRVRFPFVVRCGIPVLADAILDNLKHWRFAPPAIPREFDGVRTRVPVRFIADHRIRELHEITSPPKPIRQPLPKLPPSLRIAGLRGSVEVRIVVAPDGTVLEEDIEILSTTHPDLAEAIRKAAADWRFEPARSGDEPVACRMIQVVSYGRRM